MNGFFFIIFTSIFLQTCFAEKNDDVANDESQDEVVLKMLAEIAAMKSRVEKLERSEQHLKETVEMLLDANAKINEMNKRLQERETRTQRQEAEADHPLQRGVRQLARSISFTAYLDHVLANLGKDQPIVFNHILLNDGDAYNNRSGMFHAPVAGVYLFSWAVTARHTGHAYDVWAKLVVNGDHKVGAVSESRDSSDDNQGSNTAVLRVAEGDEVWVAHYSSYPDVYGADNERTTSFTGVLLYEEESRGIVG